MGAVRVNQLTDLLALIWALLDERAVVSEKVLLEEFVEIVLGGIIIVIDLDGELLAEHESVCEGALHWGQSAQHHCHEGVESC
jgi:hypothetical protein